MRFGERRKLSFCVLLLVFFHFYLLGMTAWLCDDAFITFRTVDNFLEGYGPTWNINERVQTYTHPFWFFLLAGASYPTGNIWFASLFLSLTLSMAVILLVATKTTFDRGTILLCLMLLTFSKAYVEYSTSGLENPLSHFLLVLFFLFYRKETQGFLLSFIACLLILNRPDFALFVLPPLAYVLYQQPRMRTWFSFCLGFTPLLMWELFSLWYYGFPFPNTAYAKALHLGLSPWSLLMQGYHYFLNAWMMDPITITGLFLGILAAGVLKKAKWIGFSLGIVLYLLYILKIGGDFMAGRFFSFPFLASVLLISQLRFSERMYLLRITLLGVVCIGFFAPEPVVWSSLSYGTNHRRAIDEHKIADERKFYYQKTGLAVYKPNKLEYVKEFESLKGPVAVESKIGIPGFVTNRQVHIIDPLGLADPLLARLPVLSGPQTEPRIGHYYRYIPEGYIDTVREGVNCLRDPQLRQFYNKLTVLTRGDLWDRGRLDVIWKMNTGQYNALIEKKRYDDPPIKIRPYTQLNHTDLSWETWYTQNTVLFSQNGFAIELQEINQASEIELSLGPARQYDVLLKKKSQPVFYRTLASPVSRPRHLHPYTVSVPASARSSGFDRIEILPKGRFHCHSMGHIVLHE